MAQRLARLTCESSKKLVPMDESIRLQMEESFKDLPPEYRKEIEIKKEMYDTVPTAECPSGTKGRVAVFEMFKVDKELQDIILKNPVNSAIYEVARRNGMLTMKEDAMLKAVDGMIPFVEAYNFNSEKE